MSNTPFAPWLHLVAPHLGTMLGFALAVILVARIVSERRPVDSAWAWMLVLILMPWVGVPLFLGLGGRKLRRRVAGKAKLYGPLRSSTYQTSVERVLNATGVSPARSANECTLLTDGQAAFARYLETVDSARHHIHLTTFILANDDTGNAVLEALESRARAGVEVRLLIDALFSFRADRRRLQRLRSAGGQVAFFIPLVHNPLRGHANLRNHRKILAVDGAIAITGGMNLAAEYMGPTPMPDRWRDVALAVRGPAVADIDEIFRHDWAFARGEPPPAPLGDAATAAREPPSDRAATTGRVQVVASGPDTPVDTFYEAILTAIFAAEERVLFATPYFVPDEVLRRALTLAIRRGVAVTIVVPAHSNHLLADLAGSSYLRDLQASGVQVRRYQPGMLHAKMMLIDTTVAAVGSANLDMRSLFLDFEISLLCYSPPEIDAVDRWFTETLASCTGELDALTRLGAAEEAVARLFAPLV